MILLTGATSELGREVVRLLKETDATFSVFTRDPKRAKAVLGPDITCIEGDLDDRDSMFKAVEGVEKLFLHTPHSANELVQNMQFIEAATKAEVKQIVKVSLPVKALEPEIRATWETAHVAYQIEEKLRFGPRGAPAYTIIHANPTIQHMVNLVSVEINQGDTISLPFGEGEIAPIDVRDVAAVVVKTLTEEGHLRKEYTLTGTTLHNMHDIAAFVGHEAERTITYRPLPPLAAEVLTALNSQASYTAANRHGEAQFFQRDGAEVVTDTAAELLGRPLRTLPEYLSERPDLLTLDHFAVQQKKQKQALALGVLFLFLLLLWRRKK